MSNYILSMSYTQDLAFDRLLFEKVGLRDGSSPPTSNLDLDPHICHIIRLMAHEPTVSQLLLDTPHESAPEAVSILPRQTKTEDATTRNEQIMGEPPLTREETSPQQQQQASPLHASKNPHQAHFSYASTHSGSTSLFLMPAKAMQVLVTGGPISSRSNTSDDVNRKSAFRKKVTDSTPISRGRRLKWWKNISCPASQNSSPSNWRMIVDPEPRLNVDDLKKDIEEEEVLGSQLSNSTGSQYSSLSPPVPIVPMLEIPHRAPLLSLSLQSQTQTPQLYSQLHQSTTNLPNNPLHTPQTSTVEFRDPFAGTNSFLKSFFFNSPY